MSYLADNLKQLRAYQKLTQAEIAKRLGFSVRTYQNYESGNREPNIDSLIQLAKIFDVSIDFLVSNPISQQDIERYWMLRSEKSRLLSQLIDNLIDCD